MCLWQTQNNQLAQTGAWRSLLWVWIKLLQNANGIKKPGQTIWEYLQTTHQKMLGKSSTEIVQAPKWNNSIKCVNIIYYLFHFVSVYVQNPRNIEMRSWAAFAAILWQHVNLPHWHMKVCQLDTLTKTLVWNSGTPDTVQSYPVQPKYRVTCSLTCPKS